MAGIVLYILTLILESISVVARCALVSGLVALFASREIALAIGIVAGISPVIHSLLVLAGIPSGHLLVRRSLAARPLSNSERQLFDTALQAIRERGVPIPQLVFVIDQDGLNAAISGRTLYLYRDLLRSPYLAGVLAHELGHYHTSDGRLMLALRALTVPGGFIIGYVLLVVLRWIVMVVVSVLIAIFFLIFALLRLRLEAFASPLITVGVTICRMLIVFAVGGVGTTLLGSLWRSYFIEREYAADAYAGRLGYANDLIAFFEREVLQDVVIPWYDQPTHPPATRRITSLQALAATVPQLSAAGVQPPASPDRPAPVTGTTRLNQRSTAVATAPLPTVRQAGGLHWNPLALVGIIVVVLALAGALALGTQRGQPANILSPTAGPTPTLGL